MGRGGGDMVNASIAGIDYVLPASTLTNADLSRDFPDWSVEKIASKTGIDTRHVAGRDEFTSDLATAAAERLLARLDVPRDHLQFVLLCTQSPDFSAPTTAAIVQERLGLAQTVGATDINMGCSGYIYGLGLAKGLIESGVVGNVLLLTADTYTRYVNPGDRSVRTLFGDGASATLLLGDSQGPRISPPLYGTDGSRAGSLIVPNGGNADATTLSPASSVTARELSSNGYDLYMDGPGIFNFSLDVVPTSVAGTLDRAGLELVDIDLVVFHQANAFMLEHLRKKLGIEPDRFVVSLRESGNTVSSTIPIALAEAERAGRLARGMKVLLVGFGVGLSWGGTVVTW